MNNDKSQNCFEACSFKKPRIRTFIFVSIFMKNNPNRNFYTCKSCSIKYREKRITQRIDGIIQSLNFLALLYITSFSDIFSQTFHNVKLLVVKISLLIFSFLVLEFIHWIYAKFEKIE